MPERQSVPVSPPLQLGDLPGASPSPAVPPPRRGPWLWVLLGGTLAVLVFWAVVFATLLRPPPAPPQRLLKVEELGTAFRQVTGPAQARPGGLLQFGGPAATLWLSRDRFADYELTCELRLPAAGTRASLIACLPEAPAEAAAGQAAALGQGVWTIEREAAGTSARFMPPGPADPARRLAAVPGPDGWLKLRLLRSGGRTTAVLAGQAPESCPDSRRSPPGYLALSCPAGSMVEVRGLTIRTELSAKVAAQ